MIVAVQTVFYEYLVPGTILYDVTTGATDSSEGWISSTFFPKGRQIFTYRNPQIVPVYTKRQLSGG